MTFRRGKARTAYIEGRANGTIDEYGDPVALPASGSSDGSAAKPPARPDEDAAPVGRVTRAIPRAARFHVMDAKRHP